MARVRKRQWKLPNGKVKVAWQVDYRERHGRRRAKQFSTKADAVRWADETNLKELRAARPATFADAGSAWIERAEAQVLELSTIDNYRWLNEAYLIPALGAICLDEIEAKDVSAMRKTLIAIKSEALATRCAGQTKMILNYALDAELTRRNITRAIKVGKSGRHKKALRVPLRDELRAIFQATHLKRLYNRSPMAGPRNRVMFKLMEETGIRPCEVRALPWANVNFETLEIEINQDAKKDNRIGPCKTAASYRKVPISRALARELQEWKEQCPKSVLDLVFPTASGKIIAPRNLATSFAALQRAAGVTCPALNADGTPVLNKRGKPIVRATYRLYALRHRAASWWIYNNVDLKRVTTWMGHASIQVTIDTYGTLIDDAAGDQAMMTELAAKLYDDDDETEDQHGT